MSQPHSARQYALAFQRPYRGWISWVPIYIDDPRYWITRRTKHFSKEPLRGRSIAFGGEQEIDSLPSGIYGSLEILVLALHLNIGFIHTVTLIGGFQMWATTLV